MPNLVGIGLSQVPTNSMLGGLAYQSPDHASIKDLDLKNLSQINSEIADTAVDIFIYDTSKDSDGGAWRKRTTHTSWYNETLNTATRGSRREFPAVAVIVATTSKVTIYDGDDPDLPMWMVFNGGANGINNVPLLQYPGNDYHPRMLNGVLVIGEDTGGDNWGNPIINFVSEYIVRADPQGSEGGIFNGGVAQRNDSVGFNSPGTLVINNSLIRDVAMIVLPDAYVDPATGLPKPTIAFATSNGVNVVYGDADDTVCTVSGVSTFEVRFYNGGKRIVFREGGNAISYGLLPTASSVNFASWREGYFNETTTFPSTLDQSNIDLYSNNYQELGVTSNNGLTLIDVNPAAQATSAGCYITSDYNTGWMHGDIKGAFLSDTDTANVTGTELVTNGTFDSNVSGWTAGTSNTITWASGGYADVYRGGSTDVAYQSFTTEIGKTYVVSFDVITLPSNHAQVYIQSIGGGSLNVTLGYTTSAGTGFGGQFTADHTTTRITLYAYPGVTVRYDNVSVRAAELDRSVNNKGLAVYGTITKSAVATDAELVAYSGWSSSNYLQQPYNGFLNVGTGDYCFMGWIYSTNFTGTQMILGSDDGGGNIRKLIGYLNGSGQLVNHINGFGNNISLTATSAFSNNVWSHFVFGRKGGTQYTYINGELNASGSTNTENISFSTNSTPFAIGYCPREAMTAFNGSLSLIRASVTFPSAEQIKKIYEDEKVLFQENAACTLYGSSDAVTALAYDDSNSILSVGTSSGRSDFNGLRRINNTTTAVTTAISAHDEFIVEQ